MTKKKVLHIGQPTGGVKTYIALAIEYCDKEKFDFAVAAAPNENFEGFCKKYQVPYYQVDLLREGNFFKTVVAIINLIRVMHKEKPDIIHLHSAKAGLFGRIAAKLTGQLRVIYTPHAFSYLSFTGIKRIIFYALEFMSRSLTDLLLAISYSEATKAIYQLGYKSSCVRIVLNSIPVPPNPLLYEVRPCINIRMIGRLTVQKDPLLFLKIANIMSGKYPQLKFAILGAGIHDHLTTQMSTYIKENNLSENVTIEQWGNSGTSARFLADADVYVSTSIFEGLPYSLLEAMSLGVPCVVSATEGNTDVIRNCENGFSCLSTADFCDKLELLINDGKLREKLGGSGYNYVKMNHNILNNIIELENIYDQLK